MTTSPPPLILAGGAESASTAPWRFWPPDRGSIPADAGAPRRYQRAPFAPPGFPDPDMGVAADALAAARSIGRARQDAYALRSHQRACDGAAAGEFDQEIVPLGGLTRDERPRRLTAARLAALRPAFTGPDGDGPAGTVTAGNASGISDGAAVVAVTTAAAARAARMPALRIISSAVIAADTALPGAGAGPAAMRALERAGMSARDVDVFEVIEAFASVALAFADDLGIDEALLCRDGGAIALGHPWGASGAIVLVRLAAQMLRGAGATVGLAACAIGGGQGIAMIVERCDWAATQSSPPAGFP